MKHLRTLFAVFAMSIIALLAADTAHAGTGLAVVLSHESMTMYVGQTETISMNVGGYETAPDGWSSSRKSVASISKKGVITAKKAGKATIICKTGFGYDLTCKVTVKKRFEVSGYLNKKYTKLTKKVPAAKKDSNDPAGIGNVYTFSDYTGSAPFIRYDTKTGKISFLQISDAAAKEEQSRLTLYGAAIGMTQKQAKKALKAAKCSYKGKQTFSAGHFDLTYKKSGHAITLKFYDSKLSAMQWTR